MTHLELLTLLKGLLLDAQQSLHWMDLVIISFLTGCYVFAAGGYMFTWWLNKKVDQMELSVAERFAAILNNHMTHLEERLKKLEMQAAEQSKETLIVPPSP